VYDFLYGLVTVDPKDDSYIEGSLPVTRYGLLLVTVVDDVSQQAGAWWDRLWSIYRPFSVNVWIALLGCCLLAGFVVWVVEDRSSRTIQNALTGSQSIPRNEFRRLHISSWISFATVTGAAYHSPKTSISRAFVIIWSFVALVIVSTYQANLTAFMTVRATERRVHNMLEVIESGKKVRAAPQRSDLTALSIYHPYGP
jgi:ionotropic kainate glutamate receptor 3/ionotropic kainate glutamate receptor 5